MNDQEKLDNIKSIYGVKPFGPREVEQILSIAEELEDRENRDFYTSTCIEWLTVNGDLEYVEKSSVLATSINSPFDKHTAYLAIASRYMREKYYSKAIETLSEAEKNASMFKNTRYIEWQQAQAWEEIADSYAKLNEVILAKQALDKAIVVAQLGQNDENLQNTKECTSILFAITKRLVKFGYLDQALETAQSIKMDTWRQSALKELDKNK